VLSVALAHADAVRGLEVVKRADDFLAGAGDAVPVEADVQAVDAESATDLDEDGAERCFGLDREVREVEVAGVVNAQSLTPGLVAGSGDVVVVTEAADGRGRADGGALARGERYGGEAAGAGAVLEAEAVCGALRVWLGLLGLLRPSER